ncbi:hypothetical protein DINM_004896 [Dirofilaria immitis]|nr:hypothetical protein [Dirofilaria immitis]
MHHCLVFTALRTYNKVGDFQLLLILNKTLCYVEKKWNYTFCWWAVDIIAVSLKPELYRNGNSSVIENNIKRICSESNHSRYGISYVNITESTYHSPIDILVEVSYYCCKNCTVYEKYSEKRIIEDLLDHYYKKRLEPLHDTDRYCFNIEGDKQKNIVDDAPCILMLNANNEMKIYSGPMLWNQISQSIVRGNEYFNPLAYLYQNGYGCNENNMSTVEDEQCRKLRALFKWNPLLLATNISSGHIVFSSTVFQKFSAVSKGTDTIPGMNEPRYYCFQPQPSMDDDLNYWTTVKLEEIQSRYRFCKFTFTVHFQNNKLERMLYKIEPDSNEMCEAALCSHTYPKCLNDLFYNQTQHLSKLHVVVRTIYAVSGSNVEDYCTVNEQLLIGNEVLTYSEIWEDLEPELLHSDEFRKNAMSKRMLSYSLQRIGVGQLAILPVGETIETPICVMALLISNFDGLDLINHLATYAVHVHSKRKIPQFYQRCSVFGDLERKEKCSSTWGCYTFTYLDARKKLTGCVDQIPALVEVIPNLSPLAWCLQIPHRESKYKCRAYKGATNLITSGTLCCCQKDCSIMIDNGEYGYNSFESVYAG